MDAPPAPLKEQSRPELIMSLDDFVDLNPRHGVGNGHLRSTTPCSFDGAAVDYIGDETGFPQRLSLLRRARAVLHRRRRLRRARHAARAIPGRYDCAARRPD